MNRMTQSSETHLSDEQFSNLLIGDLVESEARAHLLHCAHCRQEAGIFTDSVNLFSTTSLAWLETKATKRSLLQLFRSRERRSMFVSLAWATAAILFVIIGVPTWNHRHHLPSEDDVAQVNPVDSAAQVAEDNRLLLSVNTVLSSNEGSPLPESRLADYARPPIRIDSRLK